MRASEVGIWVRHEAARKRGGDVILAEQLLARLVEAGMSARIATTEAELARARPRHLHLFNIDRPFDCADALRAVGRVPYSITPLHHLRAWVQEFDLEHRTGPHGLMARCVRDFDRREALKHLVRTKRAQTVRFVLRRTGLARSILDGARLVVCSSDSETAWLRTDFGVATTDRYIVVPNFVEEAPQRATPWLERPFDVCVVGRLETRKNQLRIAKALAGTSWTVVFAGDDRSGSAGYVRATKRVIEASPNLHYVGVLRHERVHRLLSSTRVSLSLSHFEVLSLADTEALANGCRLVVSERGSSASVAGSAALALSPLATGDEIRAAVAQALALGPPATGAAAGLARRGLDAQEVLVDRMRRLLCPAPTTGVGRSA